MAHSVMMSAMRFIEILFFTGLIGCTLVVVISWISIFKEGFSDPGNTKPDYH